MELYRACVRAGEEDSEVLVDFIDFGNQKEWPVDMLRQFSTHMREEMR